MKLRRLATEALVFLLLAGATGVVANAVSPAGLDLGRNYFRRAGGAPGGGAVESGGTTAQGAFAHPFGKLGAEDVLEYSKYAGEGIFVIDARRESEFAAGHIPGAVLVNHYQQDRYLPALLPQLRAADIAVIVYCNGGDCEDSIFLATDLASAGVPADVIYVYEGGMEEWRAKGLPVETGQSP